MIQLEVNKITLINLGEEEPRLYHVEELWSMIDRSDTPDCPVFKLLTSHHWMTLTFAAKHSKQHKALCFVALVVWSLGLNLRMVHGFRCFLASRKSSDRQRLTRILLSTCQISTQSAELQCKARGIVVGEIDHIADWSSVQCMQFRRSFAWIVHCDRFAATRCRFRYTPQEQDVMIGVVIMRRHRITASTGDGNGYRIGSRKDEIHVLSRVKWGIR